MIFTSDLLAEVLAELTARLADEGIEATVHLVGGAAIALRYNPERDATRDVDMWLNAPPPAQVVVRAVAEQIANERGWPVDWLNNHAQGFIPESVGGKGSPDWQVFIEIDNVAVVIAHPRVLFAMKLLASRGRRDFPDLAVLAAIAGITTVAEATAVFEHYYPHEALPPRGHEWLRSYYSPR